MLGQIIIINDNNYYVYLDEHDDYYSYYVVLANNIGTRVLSENEAKDLLDNLFKKKMTFLEHKDDYDIYLDEGNYKRYFKNNIEDMIMFYLNNGENSILTIGKKKDKIPLLKQYTYSNKEFATMIMASFLFIKAFFSTADVLEESFKPFYYDSNKKTIESTITIEDFKDNIYNTEGDLSDNMKDYLYNEDLILDVLSVSLPKRNHSLFKKINDISVIYDEQICEEEEINGYYNPIDSNKIFLTNDSNYIFDSTLAHEYVHLLQDNNEYLYVIEACAEIIAEEYFNSPAIAYKEQRNNIRLLMEMIGPKPVFELNFKGDTSSFEKTIYDNLGEEKGKELLELLKKPPHYTPNMEKVDEKVRSLLNEMSYNITGTGLDNKSNPYLNYSKNRKYYFNTHKDFYHKNDVAYLDRKIEGKTTLDEVDRDNIKLALLTVKKEISKEDYDNYNEDENLHYYISYSDEFNVNYIKVNEDKYTGDKIYEFEDGVKLKVNDAIEKGYITRKYYYTNNYSNVNIDELDANNGNEKRRLSVYLKDDKLISFEDSLGSFNEGIVFSKEERIVIPSLEKIYPEQMPLYMPINSAISNIQQMAHLSYKEVMSHRSNRNK